MNKKLICLLILFVIILAITGIIIYFIIKKKEKFTISLKNNEKLNELKYNKNSEELVIGAYNYSNPQLISDRGGIKIFINSLRKYNKNCCIIIICHEKNRSKLLEKYLNNKNANIIYEKFKENELVTYVRFIITRNILLKNNHFKKILLSDMDDAMFQDDPFKIDFQNKLYCAVEQYKFENENFNSRWFSEVLSLDIFDNNFNKVDIFDNWDNQEIKNKYKNVKTICAGTILSNYKRIMEFLNYFKEITDIKKVNDQGLYNYYCYENPNKCLKIDQQYGEILSASGVNYNNLNKDENNKLLNKNNIMYKIVHQHNRWGKDILNELIKQVLKLGVGILTMNQPNNLKNILESYKKHNFFDICDEVVVLLQNNNPKEREIAESYNLSIIHTNKNIGIGKANNLIAKTLNTEFIIILQNDFELISNNFNKEIIKPMNMITNNIIDCYYLRSHKNPGYPAYVEISGIGSSPFTYLSKRNDFKKNIFNVSKTHLNTLLYYDLIYDKEIQKNKKFINFFNSKVSKYNNYIFIFSSKNACYTENPVLYKRDFFFKEISKYNNVNNKNAESNVQSIWEKKDFKVGIGKGLFTHNDLKS